MKSGEHIFRAKGLIDLIKEKGRVTLYMSNGHELDVEGMWEFGKAPGFIEVKDKYGRSVIVNVAHIAYFD